MLIQFPYNYANLLAFITLLKYENKRQININDLQKYREVLLNEVIENYNNKEHIYFQEEEEVVWEGKIDFYFNPNDNINNFINEFNELFYREKNNIYLYDDIDYDDLIKHEVSIREEIEEEENTYHRFFAASTSSNVLEVLKINTIKNIIEKYLQCEKQIEKLYYKLNKRNENSIKKNIIKGLEFRKKFLNIISQKKDYVVDAFRVESVELLDNVEEYKKYPIDLELWKKSEYFKDKEEEDDLEYYLEDIDNMLYDIFQYAIFINSSLASLKVQSMLENLYFSGDSNILSNEINDDFFEDFTLDFEDDENGYYVIDTNILSIDFSFYTMYLKKLSDYMQNYGETSDLLITKKRLLYVLDMSNLNLDDDTSYKERLIELKNNNLDDEDLEFIVNEVKFMASEIFLTPFDENTIKKLLFISTYYELTKDNEICDILNSFSNYENFSLYIEIIFGSQPGFYKKLT